jgi:hypothetical protein
MKSDNIRLQKAVQAVASRSKRPELAFTLTPRFADGIIGPGTAKGVNLSLGTRYTVPQVKAGVGPITQRLLKAAGPGPVALPPSPRPVAIGPAQNIRRLPPQAPAGVSPNVKLQRAIQAYASRSKRPELAYVLSPKFVDGKIGPATARGVNLSLKTRYTIPQVQASVVPLTQRLLRASAVTPAQARPPGAVPPKVLTIPPMPITAPVPKGPSLPIVSENDGYLQQFFRQTRIAGIGGKTGPLDYPDVVPAFIYDTRFRTHQIPPMHWQVNPDRTNVLVQGDKIEIVSGHDGMDDADEELAEMEASGFSKGWW